jgi:DNA repair protein RadC
VGRDKAIALKAAFTMALRMARELRNEAPLLDTPERVADLVREEARLEHVGTVPRAAFEHTRRLISVDRLSQGTLDSLLVHPRDGISVGDPRPMRRAVVLAHNHPSGDPTPSDSDIKVTRDLIRAGQLLKIEVLDHVIIGRATNERQKDYASLRELGYFYA